MLGSNRFHITIFQIYTGSYLYAPINYTVFTQTLAIYMRYKVACGSEKHQLFCKQSLIQSPADFL